MGVSIKLLLSDEEKSQLRRVKVRVNELYTFDTEQIAQMLNISNTRAKALKGLAEFQTVPSIGYKLAEKLVYKLNIFSLTEIKDKNPAALFDELEQKLTVWTDSCVEDQIRCVVHYANNPKCHKQWFDFTEERKAYREKVGFPENRPKNAWYT
ncbi:helix-hairpin-helix domain-containing protein [Metabacillus litoralis]|uniref:helix-hairpin-helix domain-containing protein n=1 Tax=Metabacillus litoralis TaxID=152268 RepID=UPI000EF59318|nr:helix-hairpin-helix domain-containing protein [Metabacillus litoralis]